ncbi:MAG: TlyA family RNA methyltransferase [Saprospiraceae bacterium]
MRLDVELVNRGLFESREKAKYAIEKKSVCVNGKTIIKASFQVDPANDDIALVTLALPYVSLGGLKLEKAILDFKLDFVGKTLLDVGASTGGFTDCAIQSGAAKVFAVDVGTEQLHPSLKGRLEVISLENLNLKNVRLEHLEGEKVDIILMDVSFTSQIPLFPHIQKLLKKDGFFLSLVKPQFEMETHKRFKGGIVRDEKEHAVILDRIESAAAEHGLLLQKVSEAPEQEGKNKEYLALFSPAWLEE